MVFDLTARVLSGFGLVLAGSRFVNSHLFAKGIDCSKSVFGPLIDSSTNNLSRKRIGRLSYLFALYKFQYRLAELTVCVPTQTLQ